MKLNQARIEYKKGNILFKELDAIFRKEATSSELNKFWGAPVFDRPLIIEGKNQLERDNEFNNLIK